MNNTEELVKKRKKKFYSTLKKSFIGEEIDNMEGDSGYINLMEMKKDYFEKIKPYIEKKIKKYIDDNQGDNEDERTKEKEIYDKLYQFFDTYLNETGTPYFTNTEWYRNVYAKVYDDTEDVFLFWKTKDLYYVKSETNFKSMNFDLEGIKFDFDASNIEHIKTNEKKNVEFFLTKIDENKIEFKVFYEDNSKQQWNRLKEILNLNSAGNIRNKVAESLIEEIEEKNQPRLILDENNLDLDPLTKTQKKKSFYFFNKEDKDDSNELIKAVIIGIGIKNIEVIKRYIDKQNLNINIEIIKNAINIFRKQNKVDYFIHKNARKFLKEQFDIYWYNYLFGEKYLDNEWTIERIDLLKNLKKIAYEIIDYIANFENELKQIWLKPKFAKNSNYVVTLDRIEKQNNGLVIIKKIIKNNGITDQIEEWQKLGILDKAFDKNDIITKNKLDNKFKFLPIDTKHFKDFEIEIISLFDDLDEQLDGRLIKSDNFQALNTLLPKYKETIQTIYIDPPFNTGKDFDYIDKFQDSTWLSLMSNRISISKDYVKKEGYFILHLDENANDFGKIILKTLLKKKVTNEIIWDKGFRGTESKKIFQHAHDTIFFIKYAENAVWNQPTQMYKDANLDRYNKIDENGMKYALIKRKRTDGTIYYGKSYPKQCGKSANDVISYVPTMASTNKQRYPEFITQKPEELLQIFIETTSNKGDLIFDFFAGSGTTIATAHKSIRKWLGIEMGNHFYSVIIPRLKEIFAINGNHEPCGISKEVNWQGGGFFKYYELEQYEDVLKRAKYKAPEEDNEELELLSNITFPESEKLLDAMEIDNQQEKVKINFQELYPEMSKLDIAESISNVTGRNIKKINEQFVEYEDGSKLEFDNMDFNDKDFKSAYKKLIWWESEEI